MRWLINTILFGLCFTGLSSQNVIAEYTLIKITQAHADVVDFTHGTSSLFKIISNRKQNDTIIDFDWDPEKGLILGVKKTGKYHFRSQDSVIIIDQISGSGNYKTKVRHFKALKLTNRELVLYDMTFPLIERRYYFKKLITRKDGL